jgi:hypothetical protein
MADELAIATNLANAVGSSKKYPFSAPEVRTAGAEESDVIAAMLTRTFPSGSSEKVRQDTFVTKLRNPTTVIFAYAPGKDYDQIVAEASRPRTSLTKTLTFRSESARWADALVDPDYYQALGRVTALDIFLYNRDRVVNANTGNWRVDLDAKSVSLIDNVFKSGLGSVLTDTRSEGRARAGLGAWWGWDLAQKLCSGRLAEIAEEVVPNLYKSGIRDPLAQAKKEREAEGLAKIWKREKSQCTAAFATGLRAGRDALLEALREPERFVQGVADTQRHVALTALYARRAALEGSADPASAEAWRSAERLAEPHRERSLSST